MNARRLAFLTIAAWCAVIIGAFAQGTAFTYQGRLNDGGLPANGSFDLTFALFNVSSNGSAVAGPITNSAVSVSNGLFTVRVDFGGDVFTGDNLWLEIGVRSVTNDAWFSILAPRQPILATPYSIHAGSADSVSNGVSSMQVFQSSGTFTVPQGVNRIVVEAWGGGGAGGGNYGLYSGGGGGGGGFGKGVFSVAPGATFPVTVGSGGDNGSPGGSSSFGALLSASGGRPGGSATANGPGSGGAGGTSTAPFSSDGATGCSGAQGVHASTGYSEPAGGAGGSAGRGGGGGGGGRGDYGTNNPGQNGAVPGGGGGAGGGFGSGGGRGANGTVVVYW